jgi:hypothetical protein
MAQAFSHRLLTAEVWVHARVSLYWNLVEKVALGQFLVFGLLCQYSIVALHSQKSSEG